MKQALWLGFGVLTAAGCGSNAPSDADLAAARADAEAAGMAFSADALAQGWARPADEASELLLDAALEVDFAEGGAPRLEGGAAAAMRGDPSVLRRLLEPQATSMALYREAAGRAAVLADRDWEAGPTLTFREYASIRQGAMMLFASAELLAAEGDFRGALDELEYGRRLALLAGSEPLILGDLLLATLSSAYCQSIVRIAERYSDDPAALRELRSHLADFDSQFSVRDVLRAEALLGYQSVRNVQPGLDLGRAHRRGDIALILDALREDVRPDTPLEDARVRRYAYAHMLFWTKVLQAEAADPDGFDLETAGDRAKAEIEYLPGADVAALRIMRPTIGRYPRLRKVPIAERETTEGVLNAFIARAETGAWPEALPLPAERATDPFADRPYGYKTGSDWVAVWSIGADLEDNGGQSTFEGRERSQNGIDIIAEARLR